ncbi:MAG: TIGR01212 family radical SAM protein, partial [Ruminiclostridium sp.]|nr:TIGR01212 family radical SAM protein [Ruminiclostridium sp.]
TPLEKDEYIRTVVNQLLYIPKETVIERLTGDGDKRYLVAPLWSRDKISVLGGIDKLMSSLDIWQGKMLEE